MWKILGVTLAILLVAILGAWLKLRGPDIPFEILETKYADADSHFVDLPGGARVSPCPGKSGLMMWNWVFNSRTQPSQVV